MLRTILKAFQLTDKEIKVFMHVLELGSQPASTISRVSEMPRNTVRSILDNLVKKGLMVKTARANTQYYGTEQKENLVRALKYRQLRQEQETNQQIEMLEQYGDELNNRHLATSRPKITFYEGTAGLEKVYEDTLTAKDGLRSWASFDPNQEMLPHYFPKYYKRRAKKGIKMISIHPDTDMAKESTKHDAEELRESILVPKERFDWTPEIQFYNNKINIVSWKDNLGIIIESQEITKALRVIFDLSWEGAKAIAEKQKKD